MAFITFQVILGDLSNGELNAQESKLREALAGLAVEEISEIDREEDDAEE